MTTILSYIYAGFPVLKVITHEGRETAKQITDLLIEDDAERPVLWFDVADGCTPMNDCARELGFAKDRDRDAASAVTKLAQQGTENPAVMFISAPHRVTEDPVFYETLLDCVPLLKSRQRTVVFIGPVDRIDPMLDRLAVRVDVPPPSRAEIRETVARLCKDNGVSQPEDSIVEAAAESCRGLSTTEAANAIALSLSTQGVVDPHVIFEAKSKYVQSSDAVRIGRFSETFDNVGGLAALKAFATKSILNTGSVRPKGVLLLGIPGVGKSLFARALGNETGRPTVIFDPAAVFGSLVGQSEERVRNALKTIDALGKTIVFIDEIEKALAGSSGQGDSGTSSRVFGTFLQWLNDRENSDAYVIATCNNIAALPPEFGRAERWDCLFFLDTPTEEEKTDMWRMYLTKYALGPSHPVINTTGWTGAEISTACRLAALLGEPLSVAARYVVPLVTTMAEAIERMRAWATGRCIDATFGGQYSLDARTRANIGTPSSQLIRKKEPKK